MAAIAPSTPRVGGVASNEIWTGGSNINPAAGPVTMSCFRPSAFKEALSIERTCVEGLAEERRLGTPDEIEKDSDGISLMTWIRQIRSKIEECGMDTVFRIVKPPSTPPTERYVLDEWGSLTMPEIAAWITMLRTTPFNPIHGYSRRGRYHRRCSTAAASSSRCERYLESRTSKQFMLNSISNKMWACRPKRHRSRFRWTRSVHGDREDPSDGIGLCRSLSSQDS